MIMELVVLDVLRKAANDSNGQARLSKRRIRQILIDEYTKIHPLSDEAGEIFSESKIRTAIDRLIDHNYRGGPVVEYTSSTKNGREYRTGFYVENDFTDTELKFLVDSVMYSHIVDSELAEDLTKRIKNLSGKRLDDITPYTSEVIFGDRGPLSHINVLKNMNIILEAIDKERYLEFTLNSCNVVNNQITLVPDGKCCVIPLQVFLSNGHYYLLAQYELKKKDYKFRLDLMTDVEITTKEIHAFGSQVNSIAQYRAEYIDQHPFVMGNNPQRFTLRVERTALTILVSTFGSAVEVVPGTVTDTTVDVRVRATSQGMKFWLLMNYKSVTLLKAEPKFVKEMEAAVAILKEKYSK